MATNGAPVPPELADRVAAELSADEQLVWVGQPREDLAARPACVMIPVGLVFTAVAIAWIVISFQFTSGLMAPCGLPFIAVGIGLLASPAWLRAMARKTVYALTSRRAIIWQPALFGRVTVQSYTAAGLGQMTRMERPDGSGNLVFQVFVSGTGDSSRTEQRGFMAIDNVKHVEELVRKTLLAGR
jgi:hypothetical protein